MPVRQVSNRGRNIIGHFPSLKLGRMIEYESLIERDLIYLLEFEPDVTWFAEQPLTIPYQHLGKALSYTPDFQVVKRHQNLLMECKPQALVELAENQRKFVAAQRWCVARGWRFQIVTDEQLRSGYRLANVKLLHQFARYRIHPAVKHRIHHFLSSTPRPVTVADVMVGVAPQKPQSAIIPLLHMAFHHTLSLPLDNAPISVESVVKLPSHLEV